MFKIKNRYKNNLKQILKLERRISVAGKNIKNILALIKFYRNAQMFENIVSLRSAFDTSTDSNIKIQNSVNKIYALALFRLGNVEDALNIIEKMIDEEGNDYEARLLCAQWSATNNSERALELFRSVPIRLFLTSQLFIYAKTATGGIDKDIKRISRELARRRLSRRIDLAFFYQEHKDNPSMDPICRQTLAEPTWLRPGPADMSKEKLTKYKGSGKREGVPYFEPKVTVIMTCFNSYDWLDLSVSSLANQTYGNLEIIVIDDSSDDGKTQTALKDLVSEDARFKLYKTSTNVGTYVAKNWGIALATGNFVTFHDSDDWAHPHRVAAQAKQLIRNPWLIANQSWWVKVTPSGKPILKEWGSYAYANPASIMIRRKAFKSVGLFDPVRIGADTEFNARIRCYYGDARFSLVERVMTIGMQRRDALTASGQGAQNSEGFNIIRSKYGESWRNWHLECLRSSDVDLLKMNRQNDSPFPLPAGMTLVDPALIRENCLLPMGHR